MLWSVGINCGRPSPALDCRARDRGFNYWDWTDFPASWVLSRQKKNDGKERDLRRSRRVLSCRRRPHLYPKLTGFQNRFRFLWNVSALLRLHAGNFWAHSCCRVNRFCRLCRTWLKDYWLLRKRQCMRDCLVPRPHYYARPMLFGSRGPRKFSSLPAVRPGYVSEMHWPRRPGKTPYRD